MMKATVADVAAELGQALPDDPHIIAQWNRWINRADTIIRARIPDLDARILAGTLSSLVVVDIQAAAVARKALNPEGLRQTTMSVDDGSVTRIVDSARSIGEIVILPEEWERLLPGKTSPVWSLRPHFTPDRGTREPW